MQQPLRRWIPPRPAPRSPDAEGETWGATPSQARPARPLNPSQVPARDLAFCAEFAVHGGVARSEDGFKGETDLLRMQQSGLLELARDPAPPFDIIEVKLSTAARTLLSLPNAAPRAVPSPAPEVPVQTVPTPSSAQSGKPPAAVDGAERRNGFEIARGMIGAAVKAEIAAWMDQGGPGGAAMLEGRLMARIIQLNAPFPA